MKTITTKSLNSEANISLSDTTIKTESQQPKSIKSKTVFSSTSTELPNETFKPIMAETSETPVEEEHAAKNVDTGILYSTLIDAVIAAKSGETVQLLMNSQGSGIGLYSEYHINTNKVPAHGVYCQTKDLTIDLNTFTYTVTKDLQGHGGKNVNQAIHLDTFRSVDNVISPVFPKITIKNGTINISKDLTSSKFIIQNYTDLTLQNVTIDGSDLNSENTLKSTYTVSNNNGNVKVANSTILAQSTFAEDVKSVALDICYFQSYAAPTVTISENSVIAGNIEIGKAQKTVENDTESLKLILDSGRLNGNILFDYSLDTGVKPTIQKISTFTADSVDIDTILAVADVVNEYGEKIQPSNSSQTIQQPSSAMAYAFQAAYVNQQRLQTIQRHFRLNH